MKLSEWRLKVTDYATNVLGKISAAADHAAARFTTAQDKANKLTMSMRKAADEVPGLNRALEMIKNPFVLAAAGALALGTFTYKAGEAAAEFNHQFLELRNLNLDKPKAEIDRLRASVMKVSLTEGLNASETSKAFFDIQSATGKYGAEVEQLVTKIGRFSIATKADFSNSINSAAKAMTAFKFGAQDIDRYLTSNAKTVQTALVTFDKLAEVQTEFGGAAAAAGQNFDMANKLFAAFTQTSKNADMAANLTKTAFQGLVDPQVIKGLEKYGIKMFDANHQFLATDKVIAQLNAKFKTMSDQDFAKFMGNVGGPEGMRALLNQVKTSGDSLLTMFQSFDNTKFDINEALKNAKGDFLTLKTIVGNQFNAIMITLGQQILPPVARAFDAISRAMLWIGQNGQLIKDTFTGIAFGVGAATVAFLALNPAIIADTVATIALNLAFLANPITWIVLGIGALITSIVLLWKRSEGFRGALYGLWASFKEVFMSIWDIAKNILGGIGKMLLGVFTLDKNKLKEGLADFAKGVVATTPVGYAYEYGGKIADKFKQGYDDGAKAVRDNKANDNAPQGFVNNLLNGGASGQNNGTGNGNGNGLGLGDNGNLTGASSGVSGDQQKVVNISFTKGLVNEIHIHAASVRESSGEMQRIVLEALTRVLNGAEQTLTGA